MSKLNEKLPRKLANQTLQKYEKVHILKVFNENFANYLFTPWSIP